MSQKKRSMSRRSFFRTSAVATGAAAASSLVTNEDYEAVAQNVNTNSQPSQLQITDMRVTTIHGRHMIRLDTNQGISGYGECRDGSSKTYALMLKSRILGMNPCNVDLIFRKLKQFGYHARQSAGPVSIEEACWDLAGKAWGVPCWQMLGGKFRDKILVYSDTPRLNDPVEMGNKLKGRIDRGFKFLKMDISISMLDGIEGCITQPPQGITKSLFVAHPFTGITITDKGLKIMADYTATIRDIVGWEIPIATDHYGHLCIESCIKLAQALDPFNLAWYEDMVPWEYTDQYVLLRKSCKTPILTGEDIYCKEEFKKLFEKNAIAICHPDLATSGGLLETKKIGDLAQEYGVAMAMHMAGNIVTEFATVNCAAATENFIVMEHHNADDEWYDEIADGVPKPIVQDGYISVPDGPGLGVVLNEDAIKRQLKDPKKEYFPPTPEWDDESSWDRLWSLNPGRKKKAQS